MSLPKIITAAVLREMAKPNETHAVRVLLHKVSNSGPYRFRCGKRQYVFTRDGLLGIHTLVVPASLWMDGIPSGFYRENPSIAADFKSTGNIACSFHIVPWGTAGAVANGEDYLTPLRDLLSKLGAPEEVRKAFEYIDAGQPAAFLRGFVDSVIVDQADTAPAIESPPETPEPVRSAAAERMRKMREAKAAKKAQLQPV